MMPSEEKLLHLIPAEIHAHDIILGGRRIHYITAGTGKPLLLLHGINIGWGQWYPNIAEFAAMFKVYALDLPGSGGSEKIVFENADLKTTFVDTVADFIALQKMDNPFVAGHSLGGWIALELALWKPPRIAKMVLIDSLGLSRSMPFQYHLLSFASIARFLARTVMRPTRENIGKFLKSAVAEKRSVSNDFIEYVYEGILHEKVTHPFLLIHRLAKIIKTTNELFLVEQLPHITIPTLLIHGEKDSLIPLRDVVSASALIPGARLEIFPSSGHVPSLEEADRFNKLVIRFFSSS